jgi:hypothetical protein
MWLKYVDFGGGCYYYFLHGKDIGKQEIVRRVATDYLNNSKQTSNWKRLSY